MIRTGRAVALFVASGMLVVACGTSGVPAGPGGSAVTGGSGAPGTTPAASPAATLALPPPQDGEVTMYGTFFAGESLDVLYNIELESTSWVILAVRSGTGGVGLLDQFTDPSFSDTFYGSYTTAGRLFGTTFGGDGGAELKSMAERDPVTFESAGLSICCTRFRGETYAIVGDTLYGVALTGGQLALVRKDGETLVPIVALEKWPIGLFAVDRHLFAVFSEAADLGQDVSVAEIDPQAETIDPTDLYEVTDGGTFSTWRVAFDDRERVAYLARGSESEGVIQLYRFRPGGEDMELVIEEPVAEVELITGLDADRGRILVQWRASPDGPTTYLLVNAADGSSSKLDVPIQEGSIGTQIITH